MSSLPSHDRATQQSPEALTLPDTNVSDIPAHILAESREMSKEVTPPVHLFFRDEGERQDGDCGPVAVIGALYYVYCLTDLKRKALKSLITYRTIRQFATTHLQHRTLLRQAQTDTTQTDGWQTEIRRAIQDLCEQVPRWNIHLDPYAPESTWVWEQIAHTEAQAVHHHPQYFSATQTRPSIWPTNNLPIGLTCRGAPGYGGWM
jgi:hypothetical protein